MVRKKTKVAVAVTLLSAMLLATACSENAATTEPDASDRPAETNNEAPAESKPSTPAVPEGTAGKYDPPIDVTTVRKQTPNTKFLPDQTLDDNVWYREFASELGINLKNEWVVNSQQYASKITVTMVSGDLPDFFEVDMQQFQTLAQAGQLADLTEIVDQYGNDIVKASLAPDSAKRKAGTVNGKLLGIALDGGNQDDAHMLYIREDWMKKLGRTAPKTMDEFIDLAIAFAKEDPDGNGKDDTYGLLLSKNLYDGFAAIDGFLNGYGAYGYNPANGSGTNLVFLKDASGKAVLADTQPEMKTALEALARLFKEGAIHPEFSVQDGGVAGEQLTSHKVGMTYGAFWVPTWPINNMHNENPEVDWGVYEVPSVDGSPAVVKSTSVPSRFMVVAKDSKHPEALLKIMNYATDRLTGDLKDPGKYHTIKQGEENYQIHTLAPIYASTPDRNQNYHYQLMDALKAGSDAGLDEEAKQYYKQVTDFRNGDRTQWVAHKLWDENGVFATLGKYKQGKRIIMTAYAGAPTPTMLSRGPALRDLEVKAFTDIIMGAKPIEHFDEFVKQWHEQGGNDILEEVNATGQVQ
ncbi:extracellular solute-binding protein [Paenibacillus sp.]|uniref:extracellular solute-binding protein n=1 Tax=Paenibacillus sp. TaxID=58172 RepID=UPI002D5F8533|nr:extracellular solute-binding protein [Paenibacillus sp.]HZG55918.1 extracellular solute-binding protein [Paenibacillus sp.]